mmetsp:Transcript_13140/g.43106  ORF Transcript_13140/g.43106 Transcript_13140/m.43106 type:complete len:230 (-) Transcript_13140:8-697(-)
MYNDAPITAGSLSHSTRRSFSASSVIELGCSWQKRCSAITAFLRTSSRGCSSSEVTGGMSAGSVSRLTSLGIAISVAHTSTWFDDLRSRRIVLTRSVVSSCPECRQTVDARYPTRFATKLVCCDMLTAWIWPNSALCPSISAYIIRTIASFIFFGLSCSVKRCRSAVTSWCRILSSSCLDLHSPMDLMSSKKSLLRCEPDMLGRLDADRSATRGRGGRVVRGAAPSVGV